MVPLTATIPEARPPPLEPPEPAEQYVVWSCIDPRNGQIQAYEREAANLLEQAWARTEITMDLKLKWGNCTMVFSPKMQQRTDRGSRDVQRSEIHDRSGTVIALVAKGGDWRLSDEPSAQRQQVEVPRSSWVLARAGRGSAPAITPASPVAPATPAAPAVPIAPAAAMSGAVAAPLAGSTPAGSWVTWASVNPRKCELMFYPPASVQMLEMAFSFGKESLELPLSETEKCNIHFRTQPQMLQKTSGGQREVLRLELASQTGLATAWLYQTEKGVWKVSRMDGEGSQVSKDVPPSNAVQKKTSIPSPVK